ncbi:cytochrome P450 [Pholiota conissans]|uniref:Cytochrome P450 n=1 Tax=Pholiota conissans TaxID=109636 RepID=A0A9P6CSY1_9AGAR|nr:cytochrome P450 [Pholiota conissans]
MDYLHAVLLGILVVVLTQSWSGFKLRHIPTIGYSFPFLSYITAFKFRTHSREMVAEGYRKYPNQIWKLSTFDGWFIVANGTLGVQELDKASGKELSGILNFQSYLQLDHTLGPEVATNPYHINVSDDMRDEAFSAFEDLIPSSSAEGHAIPIYSSLVEVSSRINARLAVGYPLCRNRTFLYLCGRSCTVLDRGRHLRFVPTFLRPIATKLIVKSSADIGTMARHLQPLVAERLYQQHLHGFEWPGKPNDTLMWLMDEAQKSAEEVTAHGMATRLYLLTSASEGIAMILSCALYEVATRPEYIKPLRDEVESVVAQEGWSKDSISKLQKMDSFLREVYRCYDLNLLHLGRRTVKDFIFSDGTLIPAGFDIFSNAYGIHYDEMLYPSAHTFDGFRFVQEDAAKQARFTKPGLDYVPFGYGKHACPGRFAAAYQMKTMLAYIITTYDIEMNKALHPIGGFFEKGFFPNLEAKVSFKRRQ